MAIRPKNASSIPKKQKSVTHLLRTLPPLGLCSPKIEKKSQQIRTWYKKTILNHYSIIPDTPHPYPIPLDAGMERERSRDLHLKAMQKKESKGPLASRNSVY